MPKGRPKGSKNKVYKEKDARISTIFRVDLDVHSYLHTKKNMGLYINGLIRKDMEEQLKKED